MKKGNKYLPEQYMIYGVMGVGGEWGDESSITEQQITEGYLAIQTALDCGINFFDLADIYKGGKSEIIFGKFLKDNPDLREKIIVQSKVGIQLTGSTFGSRYNFSYEHITKGVDSILQRLQTDYLDILLLHRPDPLMERDEIKKAIDGLFAQGKIRALGVSNMDYHQIQLVEAYTGRKVVVNQLQLSLRKHEFVSSAVGFNNVGGAGTDFPIGTIEYCILNNISLQSWTPIAKGIYSGATLGDNIPESVLKTKEIVERIAKEQKVPNDAVVLAWLMKHPAKINPVIGSKTPERIKNAMEAFKVQLSRDEWYELLVASLGRAMP